MDFYKNLHENALKELERRGYRWKVQGDFWALQGFQGQKLLNWRLWEALENLDIQLWYAKELFNRAKDRKWRNVRKALIEIIHLFNESIQLLDPKHWKGKKKHFLTIEPTQETVSKVLENLIGIRRLIHVHRLDLAELERRGQCWTAYTFMLYIDILDSIYGCKRWLWELKMKRRQIEQLCPFQILDNRGQLNCTAIDGSVGLCSFNLCPRRLWQIRRVMRQTSMGRLRLCFNFNPILLKLGGEVDVVSSRSC